MPIQQEICGNLIKDGFFNVIIQDMGQTIKNKYKVMDWCILISNSIWQQAGQSYNSCFVQHLTYSKYQSIPFKNIWIIVRPNSRGNNFDNTRKRVIILILCSTLHIDYLCSKYESIPFKNIWVIVRKQNFNQYFNQIQGDIISTIHATEL